MFLSSFRRPPSSNKVTAQARNLPAATISGTSIARTRTLKAADQKPPTNPPLKPNPIPSAPNLSDLPKQNYRKEP